MKAKPVKKTAKSNAKVGKPAKPAKPAKVAKVAKVTKTATVAVDKPAARVLRLIVAALEAKKAENLKVLDVSAVSSITDYLIVATAGSEPHLRALRIEAERILDEEKARIVGVDNKQGSGWTVVDAFEIMIHVLTPDNREKYRLESLWKDAQVIPIDRLMAR